MAVFIINIRRSVLIFFSMFVQLNILTFLWIVIFSSWYTEFWVWFHFFINLKIRELLRFGTELGYCFHFFIKLQILLFQPVIFLAQNFEIDFTSLLTWKFYFFTQSLQFTHRKPFLLFRSTFFVDFNYFSEGDPWFGCFAAYNYGSCIGTSASYEPYQDLKSRERVCLSI